MKKNKIVGCLIATLTMSGACSKNESTETEAKKTISTKEKSVDLFLGTGVTLPKTAENLKFGSTRAQAQKQVAQDTFSWSSGGTDFRLRSEGSEGVVSQLELRTRSHTDEPLEKLATEAWGQPYKDPKGNKYWLNPETKLRAISAPIFEGENIRIEPYQPLSELLGRSGFGLAFAKDKVLLGATVEELHEAWGNTLCQFETEGPKIQDDYKLHVADSANKFPTLGNNSIEMCWDTNRGINHVYFENDTVSFGENGNTTRFSMSIATQGSKRYAEEILAFFDAKFGEPVIISSQDGKTRYYVDAESQRQAVVLQTSQHVHFDYLKYMPLETLFGGEGPGLSIEPKSVFGTYPEIAKEDPEHFRASGTSASLYYPPIDFANFNTQLSLEKNSGSEKVSTQTITLRYGANLEFAKRVLVQLGKKFGSPTSETKSDDGRYVYFKFKSKKRKVEVSQYLEEGYGSFTITITK